MAGGVKKKLPVATGGKMGKNGEKWGKMGENGGKWVVVGWGKWCRFSPFLPASYLSQPAYPVSHFPHFPPTPIHTFLAVALVIYISQTISTQKVQRRILRCGRLPGPKWTYSNKPEIIHAACVMGAQPTSVEPNA